MKKIGKLALGQNHCTGKMLEIHSDDFPDALACFLQFGGQNDRRFRAVPEFSKGMFRHLKIAGFLCAALRPAAEKASFVIGKNKFRKAVFGPAGHDFVVVLADPVQTGSSAEKGQADRIEYGRFPGPDRPGQCKYPGIGEGICRQVDCPLPVQGGQIAEMNLFQFHLSVSSRSVFRR